MKYDYTIATAMWPTLQKEINAHAEAGWELVTAVPRGITARPSGEVEVDLALVFKRPIV